MSEKDMLGKTDERLLPSDLAEQCYRSDQEVLGKLDVIRTEERMSSDDGQVVFDTIKFPVLDDKGNVMGLGGVSRDISERKRMEIALRESEERLRLIIDSSPIGIRIAHDGKYSYINPMFVKMFGYDRAEEIIGRSVETIYAPESRYLIAQMHLERMAGRKVAPYYEAVGLTKAGKRIDLAAWTTHINYLGEQASLEFIIDVTESNSLRSQIVQAQKMEAIGTLAGGIAHDFNNILTVVMGYPELLIEERDELDPSWTDLQKINQAARNGADLVQRLLAFSRKAQIEPRPLNLNHQLEQLQQMLARTIPKMIKIELRLTESLSMVNADPTQMDQILMNLAVNAKDAMPDGGKLTFATANVVLDEQSERAQLGAQPGEYVFLTVSDTGQGMDGDTLHHIFEPFYTTKGAGKGTGLGLSMVYGIVKQHDGYITCNSEPGLGTTFKIYLPALTKGSDKWVNPTRDCVSMGGAETILLVDDEEMVRDLAKRILERSGYTVLFRIQWKKGFGLLPEREGAHCIGDSRSYHAGNGRKAMPGRNF